MLTLVIAAVARDEPGLVDAVGVEFKNIVFFKFEVFSCAVVKDAVVFMGIFKLPCCTLNLRVPRHRERLHDTSALNI